MNAVVGFQKLNSPAGIADQQLAIHEVMAGNFVSLEQTIQFGGKRHPVREKTNPDGGIDKNHQTSVLVFLICGLRLGTSDAPRSAPLSFRNLS